MKTEASILWLLLYCTRIAFCDELQDEVTNTTASNTSSVGGAITKLIAGILSMRKSSNATHSAALALDLEHGKGSRSYYLQQPVADTENVMTIVGKKPYDYMEELEFLEPQGTITKNEEVPAPQDETAATQAVNAEADTKAGNKRRRRRRRRRKKKKKKKKPDMKRKKKDKNKQKRRKKLQTTKSPFQEAHVIFANQVTQKPQYHPQQLHHHHLPAYPVATSVVTTAKPSPHKKIKYILHKTNIFKKKKKQYLQHLGYVIYPFVKFVVFFTVLNPFTLSVFLFSLISPLVFGGLGFVGLSFLIKPALNILFDVKRHVGSINRQRQRYRRRQQQILNRRPITIHKHYYQHPPPPRHPQPRPLHWRPKRALCAYNNTTDYLGYAIYNLGNEWAGDCQ